MSFTITGALLVLLAAWLVWLVFFTISTTEEVKVRITHFEKKLLPKLHNHQLSDVVISIQNTVIPRWKDWLVDITHFPPTLFVFAGIGLALCITVLAMERTSWWVFAVIGGIFALTTFSYVSILRTSFSIGLGCDLVYNTVRALEMDQKMMTERDKTSLNHMIEMLRDKLIWHKLTGEKATPTAEFQI